ncbi:MAG: lysylphosphatidylglycerol synthase transmembrane domain-containing protein [Spirosomataceae bacterium]
MRKNISSIVFLGISILLVYYVFKDIPYKQFVEQIKEIDWRMVGLATLCLLSSAWFRNLRWLMLFSPLGYSISQKQGFAALLLSYPANLLVPQSSFFVRASYIKKVSQASFTASFGTILAEKAMDGLVVFGLFFIFLFSSFTSTISIPSISRASIFLLVLIGGAFLFFATYLYKKSKGKWKQKISEQLGQLKTGLLSILHVHNLPLFLLHTLLIWLTYFGIYFFLLRATVSPPFFGLQLPVDISVMANVGWIFPTQGGVGSYHFFVSKVMEMQSFTLVQSAFFAFFTHLFIIGNDVVWGVLVFLFNRDNVVSRNELNTKTPTG